MPDERIIPDFYPAPEDRIASQRNRQAIRYLNSCNMLRVEPNKYRIMNILLGRPEGDG